MALMARSLGLVYPAYRGADIADRGQARAHRGRGGGGVADMAGGRGDKESR